MIDRIQRHKGRVMLGLILVNYGFVLTVVVWNRYVGGDSWARIVRMFDSERTPIAWFSSVQLLAVALAAYATHIVTDIHDAARSVRSAHPWVWPTLALGFVGLSLDEFFLFHERLREQVLQPRGILTNVPGFTPGDIGLFIPLLAGIAIAYFVIQALKPNRYSVRLFVAALALITPLVILDAFHVPWIWDDLARRRIQIVTEEIGEQLAQLLFLLSFLLIFYDRLTDLVGADGGDEA